ncbi:unnamed protein product [Callosobruchus maculatus]|uniref:MSP domain-containing protein n=1 Tax=Callosobruchus maculatus TaxID=64391 RepID=A0A653CZ43_CALMS|nr:unnamed protein product [Callosobruchus maculatus]
MSKQVLQINPLYELKFVGPFDKEVSRFLKLTNPTDKRVAYKIKTTAPKKYCVRPNSGLLEPSATDEILISLQPNAYDPNDKNKHKFMIQSMYVPDKEVDVGVLWKEAQPDQLMDTKIKCVFESTETDRTFASTNSLNITEEINKLREESSRLRQENLLLKEDMLRLKQQTAGVQFTTGKYEPTVQSYNSKLYIVLALLMGVVGYLLSSYI